MVQGQSGPIRAAQPQHGGNAADLECVRRIARGDGGSVGELYDRHATGMYSLALYILERESDAQDVVHEVFLHVRREAGRDDASNGIVGAWLLMLTRKGAVDRLRTLRTERDVRRAGDRAAWRRAAPAVEDSPAEMTEGDVCGRVRRALDALPGDQRMTIEMTYFEGRSPQESATALELPLPTVRSSIRIALLKLRAALTEGR